MKVKVSEVVGFSDLHSTFDSENHPNDQEFEKAPCGCIWWECVHCIHDKIKKACMDCEDPFADI